MVLIFLNTPPQTEGRDDLQFGFKETESVSGMTFSENISKLVDGGHIMQSNVTICHFLSNEVDIHFNMLGPSMEKRI